MPRKPKQTETASSQVSSSLDENDNQGPNLVGFLAETTKKIDEKYAKLARTALEESESNVADIKETYDQMVGVDHAQELNALYSEVIGPLNEQSEKYFELHKKVKLYNQDIEESVQKLYRTWKETNEAYRQDIGACERGIDKGINNEMKSSEIFKAAIGPIDGLHDDEHEKKNEM
ncbi:uncharacterized protein I303_102139 [Kwoniella dejecticola CBS 10117]|uniref:Biogenesis of lysosome-related organelles complex 1 subunit 5 n=1 Tax=Kwoniella dejecticola CBS 10117 TaxID=1296121 RepID=A0A1A6ABU8_9TREE|nr:uncharacterized protein I303_01720 [Kwoniella dejecticola CBS 10117]OBR87513.1 hypothetical protein I303_01720 [Kwoniella dejecticola CBS 10117]